MENEQLVSRIEALEVLLAQAFLIIKSEKNKIVYRNARKAWVDQYQALGLNPPKTCEFCGSSEVIGTLPLGQGYHCANPECIPL